MVIVCPITETFLTTVGRFQVFRSASRKVFAIWYSVPSQVRLVCGLLHFG